jgi:eukaryotic-like serine/threonine-protein kinase
VAYLAPEQCDSGAFVDNLCDIYSLGAVVYARLTGRAPFLLDRTADTLELIRIGPLVRPRQFNSTIPEEFDAIVVKMLERHQEDRFPSATALLEALQPFTAELTTAV